MFSHIVLYKVNPANPHAAERIIQAANMFLKFCIADGAIFHVTTIPPSNRSVGGNEFQVLMNFIFPSYQVYERYMADPSHMLFVRFVLRGWMIKGSVSTDPEAEFIEHILHATPDTPSVEWTRNPAIPDTEVVWEGERIYDAHD